MKKLFIAATLLAAVVTPASLVSCSAQSSKATLKTDIDSLSYAIGLSRTNGLEAHLQGNLGLDSTYMDEVVKGLLAGADVDVTNKKAVAYAFGRQMGQAVVMDMIPNFSKEIFAEDSTKSLDKAAFLSGIINGTQKQGLQMTIEEASSYIQKKFEEIQAKAAEEQYGANKNAGEQFLAENKSNEGVQVTPSGLQYKVLVEGKGPKPTATDKVKVHYRGTTIDGKEFDSSYKRGTPMEFGVSQVIPGWTEGLQLMPTGSKYMLWIPQELAYGERGSGANIEPFTLLIFEVELLDIVK